MTASDSCRPVAHGGSGVTGLPADTFLWGLDPLFHCDVKLLACDFNSLRFADKLDNVGVLERSRRPVRSVQLIGRVVSVQRVFKNLVVCLDDGSGVAECSIWEIDEERVWRPFQCEVGSTRALSVLWARCPREGVDFSLNLCLSPCVFSGRKLLRQATLLLGTLVTVRGQVKAFQSKPTLRVKEIFSLGDPNEELLWWLEIVELRRSVYNQPADLMRHVSDPEVVPEQHVERVTSKAELDAEAAHLLHYLRKCTQRHGGASWRSILGDAELQKDMKLAGKHAEFSMKMQIALSKLRREGLVYCTDKEADCTENFAALSDVDLGRRILQIIYNLTLASAENSGNSAGQQFPAARQSTIFEEAQKAFKSSKIPVRMLKGVLDDLAYSGILYEPELGSYRIVR